MIELLVAVAIFAVLTAIAIVSYTSANRRARDGRRRADLEQVRTALEIRRSDFSAYPVGSNFATMANNFLVTGGYLSTVPTDPRAGYSYYYNSVAPGTTYYLCAYLEAGSTTNCPAVVLCSATQNCNYGVRSP